MDLLDLRNARPAQTPVISLPITAQGAYDQAVLTDSPTAYWRLDETSGATALDRAQVQNGTYSGSISLGIETNPFGLPAPNFSRTGWVELPQTLVELARTHEAWIKTSEANPGVILGYQNSAAHGGCNHYSLPLYLTTSAFLAGEMFFGSSLGPVMAGTALNDNLWHHVALVVESNQQTLFVDGILAASSNGTVLSGYSMPYNQIGTGQSSVWGGAPGGWYSFQGAIANVALYPSPLTAAQIWAHFQAGK